MFAVGGVRKDTMVRNTQRNGSVRAVRRTHSHRGFTLIETALTTIIVGVGVLALMAAQQAFHKQNRWSTHASTATWLGNEIREMTLNLPRHDPVTGYDPAADEGWGIEPNETWFGDYDDVDDFDGLFFSSAAGNGPINARREIIPNMEGWKQIVAVSIVSPFEITGGTVLAGDPYMLKVDVTVTYQGPYDSNEEEITKVSWLVPE